MRKSFLVFALVAFAGAGLWATFDETEHVSRTINLDPGGTLRLKSFSGHVTVKAGDAPQAVIEAVRRGTRSQLDRIKLDIRTEGSNTVVVDATTHDHSWSLFGGRNNVVDTDLDVTVPRRTNLDLSVFSAPVTVDGIEGSYAVHSFSSRLSLSNVAGSIRAHTFSGAVEIRAKAWAPDQSIDVDTFSGNIELHVPESASGSVIFDSFSGHLNSEMPLTLHSGTRRKLRAELGTGGSGQLRFKTFSGSVKIDH
jgi:DUF4097 and DUF4098 domain-containing protein YvlB